ncbi:MAG: hydrogenase nickel incorporation protein HypB [Thiohalorhabdus sp.]|uniref:hydrogenase nickel incorporation protein HypB n=1 Tax=Thiohalorhabdus sp. TaxID=3094134 RepID=UPI00398102E6
MCNVCGCGEGAAPAPDAEEAGSAGARERDGLDHQASPARAHAPGMDPARMVRVERDVLAANDRHAVANRARLEGQGVLALNLVSGPGAGKTTLLARTVADLAGRLDVAVVGGDQQTDNDAERVRAAGARALQVNTGKGCHLDAHMVEHALASLAPAEHGLVFIENVGNLVCPAAFDLGEEARVVILSVTEGEDKPAKYPDMFHGADLLVLNKVDLLPHLDFDVARCLEHAHRVNPDLEVVQVSATTGEGLEAWHAWLAARRTGLQDRLGAAPPEPAAGD